TFGLVYHSSLEHFDKARASGADYETALREAVKHALTETWEEGDKLSPDPDAARGKPWDSGDTKKNRETLIRSIVWYLEHFKEDNIETVILPDGKPAVELSFRMEAGFSFGEYPVLICGHLDRVVDYAGTVYIMDRKTTGSSLSPYYFDGYAPHNQMTLYTLAGKIVYNLPISGVIIDAAQILVGSTNYARGFTMRTEAQLEEWLEDFRWWAEQARIYATDNYWPQNDTACDKFGGCAFRKVCSKSPEVRKNFLETEFEKNPWNPLETR
ncbi:MAG: PD-(D/E)XK nuclease family protein, partial [Patescibacteria group bacterium]|nr:PD-(D/E)XK nuclease family protein [Patescibacteria group bacterium]